MKQGVPFSFLIVLSAVFIGACHNDGGDPVNLVPPAKPGPYFVGNTTFILEDPSRALSCGPGNRRLVTEAWYPANERAYRWSEVWISDFMLDQAEAAEERFGAEELIDFPTGSYRGAPLHPDAPPMPILIFSHGFSSNRFQNVTLSTYLASHGFLVVAPDHTCNAKIAPFPDGPVFFSILNSPISLFERIGDVRFLIDVFIESPPEMFDGRLDTEHVGIFGHSFGGLTVTETVKIEPRVSAMIQLAMFGFPWVPGSLATPTMYVYGLQDKIVDPFKALHEELIDLMPAPKYVLDFIDTGHFAFSDLCRFSTTLASIGDGCGSGTRICTGEPFENPDHDALHEALNSYTGAFFSAAFFGDPESVEYLKHNHFPGMVDYYVVD